MKLPISKRLLCCASMVSPGARVADIGTDHGYLPIYLLQNGIAQSCIASDINPAPLDSARRNALKYGAADKIRFFLCDGVRGIPRDFDTMICAGVGADTMISILSAAPWLKDNRYRLILQCQSRCPQLRRYLSDNGFAIRRETLARDGKFIYPVMEVIYAPGTVLTEDECYVSPALRSCSSPLMGEYLDRLMGGLQKTVEGLQRSGSESEPYRSVLSQLLTLRDPERNAL